MQLLPIHEFYQKHFPPALMQTTIKPTDNNSWVTWSVHPFAATQRSHWPLTPTLISEYQMIDSFWSQCSNLLCSSSRGCWLRHPHWCTLEMSFNKKLPPQGDFCLPQGWIGTLMVEKVLNSFLQSDPLSASLHPQWYFSAPLYLSFPSEARLKVLHHCTQ